MFKQLTVTASSNNIEELSEYFFSYDALSITIEDQFADTKDEEPIFDEPGSPTNELWQDNRLIILFDKNVDISQILIDLTKNSYQYVITDVDDQNWVELTQDQFRPIAINKELYIVPSWHNKPDNVRSIVLDPGLAFGTGSHPTTHMCLEWLTQNLANVNSLLDYGCGSGILAIAAKMYNVKDVLGVDIDLVAIEVAKQNAINNQIVINFTTPTNFKQYDVVVANILSNPLKILAPSLAAITSNTLILSGILLSQFDELKQIYSKWFDVKLKSYSGEWIMLECKKL